MDAALISEIIMYVGFAFAAYSIVANDSIQTLGTFISSNQNRPWWVLWLWISGILLITVIWGWNSNAGDPAFGRLAAKEIGHPSSFHWFYILPPLALLILTRFGIPVSTSLLVLTGFKGIMSYQDKGETKEAVELFGSMMKKSFVGYGLAFVIGLVVFWLVLHTLEKKFRADKEGCENPHVGWIVFQWFSTGFLWSMWLVQDLANVFVYLPRKIDFSVLICALLGMVALQGYLFYNKGGKIQNVVKEKSNTVDVRSATFIDLFYGLVLLFFKVDYIPRLFESMGMDIPWPEKMPMSTTWVFLGLLAGRELGLMLSLKESTGKGVAKLIFSDAGKALLGSVIGVGLALILPWLMSLGF